MDILEIIGNSFELEQKSEPFTDLVSYLDTDTLVSWFVDNGWIDALDEEEAEIVRDYYEQHC